MHFGVQPSTERINEAIHLQVKATYIEITLFHQFYFVGATFKYEQLKQLRTMGIKKGFVICDRHTAVLLKCKRSFFHY